MATTRIIPMHLNKGKSIKQCLSDRLDYGKNPDKTEKGELVSSYACDPETADADFALSKREYFQLTGKTQDHDVIAYQVRQSFKPGEITPEEANLVGYEFAERFLKGEHAFIVCTHTDKHHIHNHIYWNSTTLDCTRKFKNFWGSTQAVRRLSDLICVQHKLSVVKTPARHGMSYNRWQEAQLVSSLQAKQNRGRGRYYDLAIQNQITKQQAKALLYYQQHGFSGIDDFDAFAAYVADTKKGRDELSTNIRTAEKRMKEIAVLQKHITNYLKTKEVYAGYRKSGYSKQYYEEHEDEIKLCRASKSAFDELCPSDKSVKTAGSHRKKLPTIKELRAEYAQLLSEKKATYTEYYKTKDEYRELLTYQANLADLFGIENAKTEPQKEHQQEEK